MKVSAIGGTFLSSELIKSPLKQVSQAWVGVMELGLAKPLGSVLEDGLVSKDVPQFPL